MDKEVSMAIREIEVEIIGDLMTRTCDPEAYVFLDTLTGEIGILSEDLLNAVLKKDESLLAALPKEEKDNESMAKLVLEDETGRFREVEEVDPITRLHWRADCAQMVDPEVGDELMESLDIASATKRFDAVLAKHPEEAEYWRHFLTQRKREAAAMWLGDIGIEKSEMLSIGDKGEVYFSA